MLRSLWIAKTGMDSQQFNLDVITNNLANSSTTAFKRVQPMFQDLLYTTLRSAGSASECTELIANWLANWCWVRLSHLQSEIIFRVD